MGGQTTSAIEEPENRETKDANSHFPGKKQEKGVSAVKGRNYRFTHKKEMVMMEMKGGFYSKKQKKEWGGVGKLGLCVRLHRPIGGFAEKIKMLSVKKNLLFSGRKRKKHAFKALGWGNLGKAKNCLATGTVSIPWGATRGKKGKSGLPAVKKVQGGAQPQTEQCVVHW